MRHWCLGWIGVHRDWMSHMYVGCRVGSYEGMLGTLSSNILLEGQSTPCPEFARDGLYGVVDKTVSLFCCFTDNTWLSGWNDHPSVEEGDKFEKHVQGSVVNHNWKSSLSIQPFLVKPYRIFSNKTHAPI